MEMTELLNLSVSKKASDLHLSPNSHPILRINGDLVPAKELPIFDADTIRHFIYNLLNKKQIEILEHDLELDFAITIPNKESFRVNVFHELNGIAAVFRVIPDKTPTLDELNTPWIFKTILNYKDGLILITGPTGSGKSTTLAAMINFINTNKACHIVTIEDPIEFTYKNKQSLINQRQLHRDTISFASALRSSLREDPDVILVGEMRDLETIRLALTAAETGHLVMATLHTGSAPHAINRIIDVFPAGEKNIIRNLISESLRAVICQRLIKKISGGRIAAFEVMLGTPAIRNLIREDKVAQLYSVMQTNMELGMRTMEQACKELIDKHVINADNIHLYETQ